MPRKDRRARLDYDNEWKKQKRRGPKGNHVRKYYREYIKKWRAINPEKEREYQKKSAEKRKRYQQEYFQKNKIRLREQKHLYYEINNDYFKKKSKENYLRYREQKKQELWKKRLLIIDKYGGRCKCCGETIPQFLALDHVNNDGKEHRKNLKIRMDEWVIRNDFPKNIQLLCHNCNLAKAFYRKCPHNDRIKSKSDTA